MKELDLVKNNLFEDASVQFAKLLHNDSRNLKRVFNSRQQTLVNHHLDYDSYMGAEISSAIIGVISAVIAMSDGLKSFYYQDRHELPTVSAAIVIATTAVFSIAILKQRSICKAVKRDMDQFDRAKWAPGSDLDL